MSDNCAGGSGPTSTGEASSRASPSIFPLSVMPLVKTTSLPGRKRRQRVARLNRAIFDVNACIWGLNWLSGTHSWGSPSTGAMANKYTHMQVTAVQSEVVARIEHLVSDRVRPADAPSPEAAFRELLRGKALYGTDLADTNLAPYQFEIMSLPDDVNSSPDLVDLLPPDARRYLERMNQLMMRDEADLRRLEETGPETIPYTDKLLKSHPKKYRKFVVSLNSRGLLRFTLTPKQMVGIFFVWKKGKTKD